MPSVATEHHDGKSAFWRSVARHGAIWFLVACHSTAATRGRRSYGPDESLIHAARARSNAAIAAHDTAALASIWLPEFHQVSSTNAQSAGRDAARTRFAELFAARPDVVYLREPEQIVVNTQWGQAAESGRWTGSWAQQGGMTRVAGIYFAKWKQVGGAWMLLAETFVQTSCSGTSYCESPPP